MTREQETIEILKAYRKKLSDSVSNQLEGDIEAFDMAIKALEQEPCDKYIKEIDHLRKYIYKLETQIVEQEPCEDAVSRQAVIERLKKEDKILYTTTGLDYLIRAIDKLPSVSTEKTRQWIPVSERLPRKGEYGKVLVTYIPSGGTLWTTVMIAHYSDLMGIAKPSFHIGEVGKESFQNITKQVTAWMPLPEPYKGESEDKV